MITDRFFGTTCDGLQVHEYTLTNAYGAAVSILDYGCTVRKILMPDKTGALTDVVLGYDTVAEYEAGTGYLGAAIGRYANRIGDGKFSINGAEYSVPLSDGPNALHGGMKGFDKFVWEVCDECVNSAAGTGLPATTLSSGQTCGTNVAGSGPEESDNTLTGGEISCSTGSTITFHRLSPDGEEGFPGNLDVYCTFTLTENNQISIEFRAVSDADTIINLTNHTYFNLNGQGLGDILGHQLMINSDCTTPNDSHCLPTGDIAQSAGTPFDFREAKAIGRDIASDHPQIQAFNGYDHNFVLQGDCDGGSASCAGHCDTSCANESIVSGVGGGGSANAGDGGFGDSNALGTGGCNASGAGDGGVGDSNALGTGGCNASDAGDGGVGDSNALSTGGCNASGAGDGGVGDSNALGTGGCNASGAGDGRVGLKKSFAKVGCGDIPFALAATLTGDISGITLNIYTDMPGIQLYTGNALTARSGKGGASYGQYSGLALETQNFPDAPNKPHFPSALLKAGETYYTKTVWEFR